MHWVVTVSVTHPPHTMRTMGSVSLDLDALCTSLVMTESYAAELMQNDHRAAEFVVTVLHIGKNPLELETIHGAAGTPDERAVLEPFVRMLREKLSKISFKDGDAGQDEAEQGGVKHKKSQKERLTPELAEYNRNHCTAADCDWPASRGNSEEGKQVLLEDDYDWEQAMGPGHWDSNGGSPQWVGDTL